jgi:hypothetical protein
MRTMQRLWHIHLSTALTATILAGILLGLNFRNPRVIPETAFETKTTSFGVVRVEQIEYFSSGWPFSSTRYFARDLENRQTLWTDKTAQAALDDAIAKGLYFEYPAGRFFYWDLVYKNLAACLLILLIFAIIAEYLVRRKLAMK